MLSRPSPQWKPQPFPASVACRARPLSHLARDTLCPSLPGAFCIHRWESEFRFPWWAKVGLLVRPATACSGASSQPGIETAAHRPGPSWATSAPPQMTQTSLKGREEIQVSLQVTAFPWTNPTSWSTVTQHEGSVSMEKEPLEAKDAARTWLLPCKKQVEHLLQKEGRGIPRLGRLVRSCPAQIPSAES